MKALARVLWSAAAAGDDANGHIIMAERRPGAGSPRVASLSTKASTATITCRLMLPILLLLLVGQISSQQLPMSMASVLPAAGSHQANSGGGGGGGSIASIQQSMAQLLQVFNGNDSQQLDTNHFKLLERDGEFVLVGARNVVYNLSLSTMREQRRLEWPSSDEDMKMCRTKGKSGEQCQNYIRVLKLQAPDTLYVCGTNAYKPRCRTYLITNNAYELVSEMPGEGACPYQETQNVTSLFADGKLYSATAAQFSGIDGLIHRQPLRTEQFNPKQLNSPNFVSSFRYGEHVYFLFREIAIEHINCGKAIYSRIARVCINDAGGPSRANQERWTSFVKARLNCSIPGEFPFYFDEIQASTQIVSSSLGHIKPQNDLLYAVFTTPLNSIGGSAVCAYRMSDVQAAFEGPFKWQNGETNSNWLPVPEERVPIPRPGTCVNDSKSLPDERINFIKDNPLMDMAVEPIWSQPLVMMASINFRFTQIAVDAQVETQMVPGAAAMRTDVIFVATDDGRVFKLINTHHLSGAGSGRTSLQLQQQYSMGASFMEPQSMALAGAEAKREPLPDVSSGTVVIEELHLFDSRTPIVNMLIHYPQGYSPASTLGAGSTSGSGPQYPKLVVVAGRQLKAVPLSRCERALTCADCLALYDPYCAWETRLQACISMGRASQQSATSQQVVPYYPQQQQYQFPASGSSRGASAGWYPANNLANNHTIGWWGQCPALSALDGSLVSQQPQVGAPYRSLFSSHLQVPSRFDYASNHHLSHTALVSLSNRPPPSTLNNNQAAAAAAHYRQPQPVSECLTFCGGLYTPLVGPQASQSHTTGDTSSQLMMNCADIVQQHYIGSSFGQPIGGGGASGQPTPGPTLYTSENLYLAVIICAASGLILGLVFGFAIGRNSKKHDSSICSSTFDETNLYMASTGSHHGPSLFGHHQQLHHHQRLLHQHQQTNDHLLAGLNGGSGGHPNGSNGLMNQHLFEANQCLMAGGQTTYGNQQQMLLHLTNQNNPMTGGNNSNQLPLMRTGQLPPLPTTGHQEHQAPLVNTSTSTTHINHAQLTPNSANGSSSACSTNTSSTSTTVPANDHHHQLFLNKQQLAAQQQQQQQQQQQLSLHQRSFTNSSSNSTNTTANSNHSKGSVGPTKLSSSTNGKIGGGQTFLQQQSQLQQPPQQNNKIYL